MSWPGASTTKQNQSEGEELVIGKYEIFIDLKKVKNSQDSNFDKSKNLLNSNANKDETSSWSAEQQKSDLFAFLSDDDSDFGQKYFGSVLSDLTNLDELDSKQSAETNNLLLDALKNDGNNSIFTSLRDSNNENSPGEGNGSSTAHFIKYLNRNGKLIKVWECGICSRNFQHQYTLMRHLPTHTNVRNFVCTECGKAFRQLSTLSQHKAIHSIERPYACETCNKSFNRISTLISHRKTHSDVKPFRCHMCNKGFHQKGNLRNHIYIHTNERPYRCSICNKGFNQMSNLVCHTQKSHSTELGSVWSCHRCHMSFSKRTLLRAHELETHHIQSTSSRSNKSKALYSRKNTMGIPDNATLHDQTDVTVSQSQISENGIVIPAIETDAMKTAKTNNEIPFAVLHFIEGLPLLVRIIDYANQSLLRPANSEDFAALKRQQKNSQEKISVPVVAAVYQTLSVSGRPEFTIMPPKNIYKFSNTQQMLSINMDNDKVPIVPTNPGMGSITPASELSSDLDISRMEIPPLFENLDSMKREPMNPEDADMFLNDIVELSSASSPKSTIEEQPKAIAIVEDNNWMKQNKSENEETENFSEAFQNIATGNLLTPKRANEAENNTPSEQNNTFGFDINNLSYLAPSTSSTDNQFDCGDVDMLSSFLNNAISEDIDVNLLRNLMSDNQKFLSDFDSYFTELLHN